MRKGFKIALFLMPILGTVQVIRSIFYLDYNIYIIVTSLITCLGLWLSALALLRIDNKKIDKVLK